MASTTRKPAAVVAAVAALTAGLAITACGNGGTTASGGGDSTAASAANGGDSSLVVLEDDVARGTDPDGPDSGNGQAQELMNNITDRLATYPTTAKDGALVPDFRATDMDPVLAESWKRGADGKTWTFKLRQGVKSCDGNEMTSADVLYTFARGKSASGSAPIGWFLGYVSNLWGTEPLDPKAPASAKDLGGELKALDDYTVQFKQKEETDLFPRVLEVFALHPMDSKVMKAQATAKDPWSHKTQVRGFGPYCLSEFKPGQRAVLTVNPNYWGEKPAYTKVTITKVPSESDRIAAMTAGEADIVTNLTPKGYERVKQSGSSVLGFQGTKVLHLGINYQYAPFDTPAGKLIRQAIANVLPYDAILNQGYLGSATKAQTPIPSAVNGWKELPGHETDIEAAKQLLTKAGFPGGKGLEKFSKAFTLYYVTERATLLEPIANQIKTAFAQVGIPLRLAPISQTEEMNRETIKRDMPMFLRDSNRPVVPDAGYTTVLWHVSTDKGGLGNSTNYSNPKVDAAYAESQRTSGPKRQAQLDAIQEILAEDLPLVPIAEVQSQIALRKGITNWLGTSGDTLYFASLKPAAK